MWDYKGGCGTGDIANCKQRADDQCPYFNQDVERVCNHSRYIFSMLTPSLKAEKKSTPAPTSVTAHSIVPSLFPQTVKAHAVTLFGLKFYRFLLQAIGK